MYDVFRLFGGQIQAQLRALSTVLERDLPAVNGALTSAGGKAIVARAVELRLPAFGTGR